MGLFKTKQVLAAVLAAIWAMGNALAAAPEKMMVWPAADGEGLQIYVSEYRDGQWSAKKALTEGALANVTPSAVFNDNGKIWLVWAVNHEGATELFYATSENGVWSEKRKLHTEFSYNTAPQLFIDELGDVWLTWAGFDGEDDEIFVSHWAGDSWSRPKQVNDGNNKPDLLPEFFQDNEGRVGVRWQEFNDVSYQYETVAKILSDAGAEMPARTTITQNNEVLANEILEQGVNGNEVGEDEESYPADLPLEVYRGAIFSPNQGVGHSVPIARLNGQMIVQ